MSTSEINQQHIAEMKKLQKLLEEKDKEVAYYKSLAQRAGDQLFREVEELSNINGLLKSKMDLIQHQKDELKSLYSKIETLSITDELTGLLNRRGLMMHIDHISSSFTRDTYRKSEQEMTDHLFCCAILDIDYFKKVNDNYGHLAGDLVLKEFAALISTSRLFREVDAFGRYGGEEFMVVLRNCTIDQAMRPINRLMKTIQSHSFRVENRDPIGITASIGVAVVKPSDTDFNDVFRRADKALYRAKSNGRNRIEVCQE